MSCENCTQKVKDQIDQQEQTYKKALALANETGQWVAICEAIGGVTYVRADKLEPGQPVKQYVSPKL